MNARRRPESESRLTLVAASRVPASERARLVNEAYAGYFVPLHVTEDQVSRMDRTYDVDLARSVVAFVGGEPAGMALLGRRDVRGWLHSVGTLPAWRRLGIARAMVADVVAAAGEAGVRELSLEVFTQNIPAQELYVSLGFRSGRELLTWQRSAGEEPPCMPRDGLLPVRPAMLYDLLACWQARPAAAGEDERPCWQREVASLRKMGDALQGYRLRAREPAAARQGLLGDRRRDRDADGGCLVSENDHAVAIMAAGLRGGPDPVTGARALLGALCARYPGRPLSMLNVSADSLLCHALAELRFTVSFRQVEMVRRLG